MIPDLEGHIITVPEVRMSPDLKLATVYVMPLGGRDTDKVIAALERNKKFLRGETARRVNLKFAPDLRFRVDERFDEAERIEKLLRTPAVQRDLTPRFGQILMIVTTANSVIEPPIGDSDALEKNISADADAAATMSTSPAQRQAAAPEQPAAARQARRPWLGRARQADRHDLDPCGRGREAAVPGQARRPCRHARSAGLRRPADRDGRSHQDGSVRDGRPQALPLHGVLGRGTRHRRYRGPGRPDQRDSGPPPRRSGTCCRNSPA